MCRDLVRGAPRHGVDTLLGLGFQNGAGRGIKFVPPGAFQLPAFGFREIIGMQRLAQRTHDLGRHAGLLPDLPGGTLLDALTALQMPFRQVPAAVAVDHQPLPAAIHHDAARRLDGRKLRRESRKSRVGIGGHDGHAIVRFEKIQYLVP